MATTKKNWMKRGLMGSTTLPLGTAGSPLSVLSMGHGHDHGHAHKADGSCCGHDHGSHDHHHHDHEHDEDCTSPGGSCC